MDEVELQVIGEGLNGMPKNGQSAAEQILRRFQSTRTAGSLVNPGSPEEEAKTIHYGALVAKGVTDYCKENKIPAKFKYERLKEIDHALFDESSGEIDSLEKLGGRLQGPGQIKALKECELPGGKGNLGVEDARSLLGQYMSIKGEMDSSSDISTIKAVEKIFDINDLSQKVTAYLKIAAREARKEEAVGVVDRYVASFGIGHKLTKLFEKGPDGAHILKEAERGGSGA
ncbi:hypothetical protein ABH930_006705 [Kitasatospora sp. GAS204A]|uniref:hypothetical protein n=1 Tax=unclassified Kitasatospora TaxID=2633591 RepID=UPI0024737F22|nr:hypothetical protein [Kitasatospora sp. GAS204B]MDH6122410.1 hypothetical protein [Kitasatospora sp. GAS204B]